MKEFHETRGASHKGRDATLVAINHTYYWLGMTKEVEVWVAGCPVCRQNKADHRKSQGLLQPLPVPMGPWKSFEYGLYHRLA